jgi:hypothetical protein
MMLSLIPGSTILLCAPSSEVFVYVCTQYELTSQLSGSPGLRLNT